MMPRAAGVRVRPIDPKSESEVERVAQWMRATLMEVEGEATGASLYAMDWLRERVRWHLNSDAVVAAIFLAEDANSRILGHTIVRCETDECNEPFGLFSTTYVEPGARRLGVAESLLRAGERWFEDQALRSGATWTSSGNTKLIQLYEKHGYRQTATYVHDTTGTLMVKLEKQFPPRTDG